MMEKIAYPKSLQKWWVRHLIFWVVIVSFFSLPGLASGAQVIGRIKSNFLYLPLDMCAVYIVLYLLLPRVLNRKNIYYTIVLYVLLVISVALISKLLKEKVYTFLPTSGIVYGTTIYEYFNSVLIINMIIGAAVGVKLLMLWYTMQLKSQLLNRQKTETELAHLRSQLNPHFLFNTLNNIDSLVLNDPAKGSEALLQLSDILRYAVYETKNNRVSLSKEIEYLQNYIWLQKIRLACPSVIHQEMEGEFEGYQIAPMLFIPILENAFKHGDKDANSQGIRIHLSLKHPWLTFKVTNDKLKKPVVEHEKVGGVGLSNLERRLQLLYPGSYEFETEDAEKEFTAILKINLV